VVALGLAVGSWAGRVRISGFALIVTVFLVREIIVPLLIKEAKKRFPPFGGAIFLKTGVST
jgi:hypothetical protein